jgi:hypothetical protein
MLAGGVGIKSFAAGLRTREGNGIRPPAVGLNVARRLSLDVAAYGATANAERERRTAVDLSLRINP